MAKKAKFKQSIMSCVLTFVMIASVVMVPAGEVKAAENLELVITNSAASPDENGNIEIQMSKPAGYDSVKSIIDAGYTKLEIEYSITEYNGIAGKDSGIQAYYAYGESWKYVTGGWKNLSNGDSGKIEFDLSAATGGKEEELKRFGVQIANVSDAVYTITSAKLIYNGENGNGSEEGGNSSGITDDDVTAAVYPIPGGTTGWAEYNYSVSNGTDGAISAIKIKVPFTGTVDNLKSWNCNAVKSGAYIIISHSSVLEAGGSFTCKGSDSIKFGFGGGATLGTPTVEFVYGTEGAGTSSSELKYELTGQTKTIAAADTPVGKHGKLKLADVDGYDAPVIVDKNGKPFQLRGASSHGIQWDVGKNFVNKGAYQSLRDEWGVNMVRLAVYVTQNGYTAGAQSSMDEVIQKGVEAATDLGMYVIIDWHVHELGSYASPHEQKTEAESFFTKYATKYKDYDNVIFEICNEPVGVKWYDGSDKDLYSYCKSIVGIIRDCGSDALIVCGTNTWSQDVDEVKNKPLKDDNYKNILYTFHFYAGSHFTDKMEKVKTAVKNGTPLFVTEFGICDASGNGGINTANADDWINLFDKNGISYCCWSCTNLNESASYLKSSCSKKEGGWVENDLGPTGIWLVNTYRAHQDAEEGINSSAADFTLSVEPENGILPEIEEGYTNPGKFVLTITNTGDKELDDLEVSFGKGTNTDFEIVKNIEADSLDTDGGDTIEISLKKGKTAKKYADSVIVKSGTIKKVLNISQTVKEKTVLLTGINLSKESITIEKGDTVKIASAATADIIMTAKPKEAELGELTYVSGNSNVAAVSKSGVITAIGKGSTTITIKSGTVVAELTVNVKVTPTGVDLKDAVTLTLGEDENSLSLVAKAYPEDSDNTEIVWTIPENDVINAVVDENESSKLNITALKKGSVTITAKIKDTDINKSCVITVAETVNSIEISDSEITLITKEGSNTKQLTSVTKPTGIDGIAWDSSDPKVAMVDQTGLVTAIGNGTATITASVGAKKDSCQVTVIKLIDKVTITDSTGEQVESLTMTVGDTKILDGAVSPADATGAGIVKWVVDKGTDVVSFDSQTGTLKALKEGSASVVITAGENIGQIENTKQNTLNISVNKKQLPDVEKLYVIELNRLPGGKDYTDDTYLNSISGNAEGQTKLADYDKAAGKLTLLGDSDYKLTGNNEEIVINSDKTEGTETEADNPTVVLDNAVVKSIDTVATVKINGITTIKDNVTAKSIVIEGTKSNVNVGGTIKADNIVLNTGTVSVESGIKATDTITIGSNIKLTVRSAKKSDGTLESAIDAPNITVKDGAEIKADEETKTVLFSNTPKDETGKAIDVSKYTGSSNSEEGDNEGNNNNDNGSSSGKTENNGGNADNKDNKGSSDNNGSGTTDSDKKTESQQNNSDQTNTNDQQTGQTTGGNSTGVPVVKATDMTLTTDVKAVKGVTISGTYQLAVKKSMVVEAAFTPEDAVKENITLTSSNPKVVTVNGTKLTAKKAGTSRITVTSENGLTKIFKVKVMKKAVSKVKLKASKRSVKIGKTLKLKAATYPSKKAGSKVYWKSSNESIATVTQKGVVKGIKKGKVKIIATALDGSGKKKDIKITVR